MFCSNCGATMEISDKVCPKCGTASAIVPEETSDVPKVPNYLIWSIVATLLCCLPFGIVSIVYSCQVNSKLAKGDVEGARASSKSAKRWLIAAVSVGAAFQVLNVLLNVLVIFLEHCQQG